MTQGASAGLSFKARRQFTLNGHTYERGDVVPLAVIPPNKFEVWRSSRLIVPAVDRPRSAAAQSALAMQEAGGGSATGFPKSTVLVTAQGAADLAAEVAAGRAGGGGGNGGSGPGGAGPGGIPGGEAIQGEPDSYIQHVGRGWFVVYHAGVEPVKVRGAGPASDKLRELRGEAGEGKGVTILGGGDGEKAGLAANGLSQDEPSSPGDGACGEGGDATPLADEDSEAAQMAAMIEAG